LPGSLFIVIEAALAEELQHLVVVGLNLRLEDGHAVFVGGLGQPLEQQRSQAAALERVGDREADERAIGREPLIARLAHDLAAEDREHAAVFAVDAGPVPGRGLEIHVVRPESQPSRLRRKPREEGKDGRLVGRVAGPDMDRRAVAEDCVDVAPAALGVAGYVP
jgi:hypothetical protein